MSLTRKDSGTNNGGLRVATDSPHLVSLGGGRLSTAVTIHHLPIGELSVFFFLVANYSKYKFIHPFY